MNTQFWLIQTFNGISYGALLFLVGSGLSLIFGVMRIVNLSHGSYFLLGGYVALSVIWTTGSWLLALPVAALVDRRRGPADGAHFPAAARVRSAAAGAADGRLRVPVPAGGARHLDRQQLRHQPARGADQERRGRRIYLPLYRVFMIATALVIGLVLWLVDGEDPHGRGGARHRRRRADGARRRHRHLAHLHVHFRARRVPGGVGRRDRRRLPRHLSRDWTSRCCRSPSRW